MRIEKARIALLVFSFCCSVWISFYHSLPTAIIAYAFLDYNMQNQQRVPLFRDGSYCISPFFQSVCNQTTFTLSDKTEPKKVEKYPPSLGSYNDSQARHSTNYQQISAEDTARSPPTQHISEKSICIAYPDKYRKRHSYSLPRYSGLYCISE